MSTGISDLNNRSSGVASLTKVDTPTAPKTQAIDSAQQAENKPLPVKTPVAANTEAQTNKEKPSLQEVIQISERLNDSVQKIQRDINFTVDESLGEIVVKVVDRETQETIRQIPSEEMLKLSRNFEEVNSLLFDKIKV